LSLPSKFFNYQDQLGETTIRMKDVSNNDSQNLYEGKIFILRNEPWEPYLNHAVRIANNFSIKLNLEFSNYDDSLISFPKSNDNPVIIWINWNRIVNKKKYIKELGLFSEFKNKVYLVLPNAQLEEISQFKKQVNKKLPWLNLIQLTNENENFASTELGYSKTQLLEITTFIGQNIVPYHFYPQVKAIITDLDNTLYSGILGEDAISNLRVSDDHIILQKKLSSFYSNGVLLNIASKNNNTEVDSLLHTFDIVSVPKHYFTCIVANWASKSVGVSEILLQLNIDEESVVFLDDNPRELAEVGSAFPRMLLINANDPKKLNKILDLKLFSRHKSNLITSELRSTDIKANIQRRMRIEKEENNDEVLKRINTKITTKLADLQIEFDRAEELFKKTNQFNFSNRRTDMKLLLDQNSGQILTSKVSDIFSDSGIISALMYSKINDNGIEITEFVISCRALGRGIEKYIFKSMVDVLCNMKVANSDSKILINFTESTKNIPAKYFLNEWFTPLDEPGLYKLNHSFSEQVENTFGGQ
jgi:FkbH-like protein